LSMNTDQASNVRPILWEEGHLRLLDQRRLPHAVEYVDCRNAGAVAAAIREMVVRGAPAIGIAAAYGVVLAARTAYTKDPGQWRREIQDDLDRLAESRPTAINLHWALCRMRSAFEPIRGEPETELLGLAGKIHEEDIAANLRMSAFGAALIADSTRVLTHCNTGSLATGGFGTALGVIRAAFHAGTLQGVYATETRPWLQGARLTVWELQQDHIPVTLIADSAAHSLLAQRKAGWIIVGADRIAANGDVANKIGTYGLALSARHHGVGFMVAAPVSTFDPDTPSGAEIPIEDRDPAELIHCSGAALAPAGTSAWNPVFDVTPASLIDVIVTERGVIRQPDRDKIAALIGMR
jgi:S-methyl-5-thioribose-1-phosphate isomerase